MNFCPACGQPKERHPARDHRGFRPCPIRPLTPNEMLQRADREQHPDYPRIFVLDESQLTEVPE